ncbi:hypothetical protein ACQ1PR_03955 [Ornithobacterium rhinotracheale]
MKKSILLLSVLAMGASLYAQQDQGRVGINTTKPKATLDISKEGVDDAKGLLIPRLTADEVKTMTDANKVGLDQNSLLLYVTQPFADTKNKTGKYELIDQAGYYYYDAKDNGGKWKRMSESESLWENDASAKVAKLKTLSDGTTERADDKNIFVRDNGYFGIGTKPNTFLHLSTKSINYGNDIVFDYYNAEPNDPLTFFISRFNGPKNSPNDISKGDYLFNIYTRGLVNNFMTRLSTLGMRYQGDGTSKLSDFYIGVSGEINDIYIKEDHRVGIGTVTPTEKLDVDGNVRVRGESSDLIGYHKSCKNVGTITYNQKDNNFYGCTSRGWEQLNVN